MTAIIADGHYPEARTFVNWFGPNADLKAPPTRAISKRNWFGIDTTRELHFAKITLEMLDGEARLARPADAGRITRLK